MTYVYQAKVEKRFAVHRKSIHPAITPAVVYQQQRGKHGSFVVGWSYVAHQNTFETPSKYSG